MAHEGVRLAGHALEVPHTLVTIGGAHGLEALDSGCGIPQQLSAHVVQAVVAVGVLHGLNRRQHVGALVLQGLGGRGHALESPPHALAEPLKVAGLEAGQVRRDRAARICHDREPQRGIRRVA